MSTMATEVKATTMEQRMKGLLDQRDWEVQGKSIINDSVQELFHKGTPAEELRRIVLNDERWPLLNERQKAFILSEVDLVGCPVKVGDMVEVLVDNASSAPVRRGQVGAVTSIAVSGAYDVIFDSTTWVIGDQYYRLVPSLEFPLPSTTYTSDDVNPEMVNPEMVKRRAQARIDSFVQHTGNDGRWSGCECNIVMQGVDVATPYFVGNGVASVWARTPEGKRYIGEVIRWMRAMVVQKWIDSQSREATVPEYEAHAEPEPIPERVLDTPTPVEPTMESLAAAIDTLTRKVESLGRENEVLAQQNRELRRWQSQAIEDAEKFCNALSEIADRRELCSEFEESIDTANRVTSVLQFQSTRSRTVEVRVTGTVSVPFSVVVEVEVGRDDDAESLATERVENDYSARTLAMDYGDHYAAEFECDDAEIE